MTWILAWFGYVKVPREAIQMSMVLEDDFKDLIRIMSVAKPAFGEYWKVRLKASQVLTKFLRSGKLLNQ